MFFRRERAKQVTFDEYLNRLRQAGFTNDPAQGTRVRIRREGVACWLENANPPRVVVRTGIVLGDEIGTLVDGGYQKFFQTPAGKRRPAQASDLRAIHDFEEDLREALGLETLYNEALGTVSNLYLYDRVEDRDGKQEKKPWEIKV